MLEYIGLPVPGEAVLSMLGFLSTGFKAVAFCSLFAAAGTFLGSMFAYFIGLKFGEPFILKLGKPFHITKDRLDSAKILLERNEAFYIIASRYIPGVRHVVPYLGGILHLKIYKYVTYNLISSLVWSACFIAGGYLLGENWHLVERYAAIYLPIFIILIIFVFVVYKVTGKYKAAIYTASLPLFLFIFICIFMLKNAIAPFDSAIYNFISGLISINMTHFMRFITHFGSSVILTAISALAAILFRKTRFSYYFNMFFINLLSTSCLSVLLGFIFHRHHPEFLLLTRLTVFSFPSSHSMISISFYGFLIYLCLRHFKPNKRLWGYTAVFLLTVLILLIGFSRIYLGAQYASDIIAGYAAGLSWLAAFILLSKQIYRFRRKNSIQSFKLT